jgi:hypothetical protein
MQSAAFKSVPLLAALLSCCLGFSSAFALTGTINGLAADGQADQVGAVKSVSNLTALHDRVGNNSADGKQTSVIHVFQIPSAILSDPTLRFDTATYSTRVSSVNATTRNADLYGLGYRTSSALLANDAYVGALDGSSTLLKDNFIVPSIANYTTLSASGVSVVDYLNAQLTAARAAGATTAYVFFRISLDSSINWQFYQLGMTEAGGVYIPTLAYTTALIAAEPEGTVIMVSSIGGRAGKMLDREQRKDRQKTDAEVAKQKAPNA